MNARLEGISDKIRMGIPVDFMEALEAIEYQEELRKERIAARRKTLWGRFMLLIGRA